MKNLPEFSKLSDKELEKVLKKNNIGLLPAEARFVAKEIGRNPTLTEAILWGIQGSEHCSYKSSRRYLKTLPTKAPNVILGPGEDAGIVEITKVNGERYGLIVGHESHNHPSQIVPYEGAATGIGGCVRDIVCMGGRVLGSMDPLRFGNPAKNEARQIADGVVDGIGGYGNPIGVPNLGGDAYFNDGYNENCLVNVVSMGLVKESNVIHSYVPKTAAKEKWDIIIVGKPTDNSGMGGAAFASGALEESEKEKNKGAVQEPNPFLKRHLLISTYDLFEILQKKNLIKKVSFKDMGAGGVTCSTVEQVAKAGFGARIDLGKVNVSIVDLPPSVIGCAETQERFTWMCHPDLTKMIVDHYNKKWDLPSVADNAGAFVVGKVVEGNYVLQYRGEEYVNAPSKTITEALSYKREYREPSRKFSEPDLAAPGDYGKVILQLLESENIASRKPFYERYDKQVQGFVILESGEADAGVLAPLMDEKVPPKDKKIGMAFSTDGNPRYGLISPFHGAANAVVESMRNVAAVGAYPQAITNCLNYGNPEKPEQMWELKEGIRGITKACTEMKLKNHRTFPTPVISGNVSLYNETKKGHIPPSAIICCIGKIDDYGRAVTMALKKPGNKLFLLGARKDELGGSEYYKLHGELGANVPVEDFREAMGQIYALTDAIADGLVASAHDISEGGLAVALAEMSFGGRGEGRVGAEIDLAKVPGNKPKTGSGKALRADKKLFSQTGGFVVEVPAAAAGKFTNLCKKNGITAHEIGATTKRPRLIFREGKKILADISVEKAAEKWLNGLRDKL
ncbi:phosphoribosylformylglycinamidine synthase subunit PurL [Patescibacteria group bacterium]|nr:phosphoribosylformylglycinamidine synthase subunit PurL [Patescibacteria group bacterium]MBU1703581.1 phosphoribosylformylglycinamidine synthase subunit PurL [Patescibacteria group bacterium]MBU1954350.1 phosphoribosylformylglycinamidine synthase subunit PurL [Patescibacteria group bacterium]